VEGGAPPFNLVVESSMMTPEDRRKKKAKINCCYA
jgi:hypothetical protein